MKMRLKPLWLHRTDELIRTVHSQSDGRHVLAPHGVNCQPIPHSFLSFTQLALRLHPSNGGGGRNPSSTLPPPLTPSSSTPPLHLPEADAPLHPPPPRRRTGGERRRRRWWAPGGGGGGEAAEGPVAPGAVGDPVGGAADPGARQRRGRGAHGRARLGRRVAAAAAGAHLVRDIRRRRQVLLRRRAPPFRPHRSPVTVNNFSLGLYLKL